MSAALDKLENLTNDLDAGSYVIEGLTRDTIGSGVQADGVREGIAWTINKMQADLRTLRDAIEDMRKGEPPEPPAV